MEAVLNVMIRLLVVSLAAACVAPVLAAEQAPARIDGTGARIRMFGQNGVGIVLYKGRCVYRHVWREGACVRFVGERVRLADGIGEEPGDRHPGDPEHAQPARAQDDRFQAVLQGICDRSWQAGGGGSRCQFAGALTSTPGFKSGWTCGPLLASTFVPEAGADYEVALDLDFRNSVCTLAVKRVAVDGQVTPVDVAPVSKDCK